MFTGRVEGDMIETMIVYMAHNTKTGKVYVGKTKRSLVQRRCEHVKNAMIDRKELPLYFAGLRGYKHIVKANQHMSEGNPMYGIHHSVEARKKIAEALSKRVRSPRAVIQYDMIGNVIATYQSTKGAAISINGHKDRIGDGRRGGRESHAGHMLLIRMYKGLKSWAF